MNEKIRSELTDRQKEIFARANRHIIDTHAHYNDLDFDIDREELLHALDELGISRIVNIGTDARTSAESLTMANTYAGIYAAVGIHPSCITENLDMDAELLEIEKLCDQQRVVAIGEIGYDYYWDVSQKERQREGFIRQIDMARRHKLPIVVHSREAAKDTMDTLAGEHAGEIGGVVHCYSYSMEDARKYVDMGLFIGIGGVITFKNAKKIKEVVADIPLSSIVLETDAPYLAPVPFRGKRNASYYLPFVIEAIAEIKGISMEEVMETTYENAFRLYPRMRIS